MKTIIRYALISLLILSAHNFLSAEKTQLWTTTLNGGDNGLGVIYQVNNDGTNGAVAVNFNGLNGANPSGIMVEGHNNIIYGTTTAGGQFGTGVLFGFDATNNTYSVLHHFDTIDGWSPRDLLLASDGKIYGTTQLGGANRTSTSPFGAGVMYSFNPADNSFLKLIDFGTGFGECPQALMQAGADIYGLTRQGGANGVGTIFKYTAVPNPTVVKLYDFDNLNGALPTNCKLNQVNDHTLTGVTTWGGTHNMGVVFSFDVFQGVLTKLYDFDGAQGAYPTGTLFTVDNNVLFGTTLYGGQSNDGILYQFNLSRGQFADLHDFNGTGGAIPNGNLTLGSDNLVYGITTEGGATGTGTIFNFNINTGTFHTINDIQDVGGASSPSSNIVELVLSDLKEVPASTVSIYPNPAQDNLNIQTGDFKPEVINVIDVNGRVLVQTKFANQINIQNLPAGLYSIELKNSRSVSRTRFSKF